MPQLRVTVPHKIEPVEAQRRLAGLFKHMEADRTISDLRERWSSDTNEFQCKIKGFAVSGSVCILDDKVVLVSQLPFAAIPFKSSIEATIRRRAYAALFS